MAGKTRPRSWYAHDAMYLHQDTIRELGRLHGPAGPLVFDCLIAEAKLQKDGGNVPGDLDLSWRSVAALCWCTEADVRRIVETCFESDLLGRLGEGDDTTRLRAHLVKRGPWEPLA